MTSTVMQKSDGVPLEVIAGIEEKTRQSYCKFHDFITAVIHSKVPCPPPAAFDGLLASIVVLGPEGSIMRLRLRCINVVIILGNIADNTDDEIQKKQALSILSSFITKNVGVALKNHGDAVSPTLESLLIGRAVSALPYIMNLKVQSVSKPLDRLLCLRDRNSIVHKKFVQLLLCLFSTPYTSTQDGVVWLNTLELDDVRTKHIGIIVPAVFLARGIDIPNVFFIKPEIRRQSLHWLDSHIQKGDRAPPSFKPLLARYSINDLRKRITEYAKVFDEKEQLRIIPNTIGERRAVDLQQKLRGMTSDEDKFEFIKQMIGPYKMTPSMFSRVAVQNPELLTAALLACKLRESEVKKAVGADRFYRARSSETCRKLQRKFEQYALEQSTEVQHYEVTAAMPSNLGFPDNKLHVYFVDDVEKFEFFLTALWNETELGFDVEGSYVCQSALSEVEASVLQVALSYNVYVLDLFMLKKVLKSSHWSTFWYHFCRYDMRRIGFDVQADIRMLQSAPGFKQQTEKTRCDFECLKIFMRNINEQPAEVRQKIVPKNFENYSLNYITGMLLGQKMDKGDQCSNWQKRPVSPRHLLYAAKDAIFTQLAFNVLRKKVADVAMAFPNLSLKLNGSLNDKHPQRVQVLSAPAEREPGAKKKAKNQREANLAAIVGMQSDLRLALEGQAPKNPRELFVVVERAFFNAVPYLRQCGFQVLEYRMKCTQQGVTTTQEFDILNELIHAHDPKKSNLYFLTNYKPLCQLNRFFHSNHIIKHKPIGHDPVPTVVERVLRTTQVTVDESIFLNCPECGSSEHTLKIPVAVYKALGYCQLRIQNQLTLKHLPDDAPETAIAEAVETNPEWKFDTILKIYESGDVKCIIKEKDVYVSVGGGGDGGGAEDEGRLRLLADHKNPRGVENFLLCTKCFVIY